MCPAVHLLDGEVTVIDNEPVDSVAPAGSVWSSAADLARWVRMLLAGGLGPGAPDAPETPEGGRVLAEETVAELLRPQTLVPPGAFYPTQRLTRPHWITYGLGWFQQDYRGLMVQFHTGSIDGMAAIVGLVPEARMGVVVLQNLDHAELRHALLWSAIDRFAAPPTEAPDRDWSADLLELYGGLNAEAEAGAAEAKAGRIPGTSPSLPLARYAGVYSHPLYDEIEIRLDEGGALRLLAGSRFTAALEHWHYDTFLAHWDRRWQGEAPITFVLDTAGDPAELRFFGRTFERVEERTSDAPAAD